MELVHLPFKWLNIKELKYLSLQVNLEAVFLPFHLYVTNKEPSKNRVHQEVRKSLLLARNSEQMLA